ncbi:MAG TPA: hypothetical protein VGF14_03060 [Alphaproteobacteria bacterium]
MVVSLMIKKFFSSFFKADTQMAEPQVVTADPNRVRYIIVDMHNTATENPELIQGLAAFKEKYNVKIVACGNAMPGETEESLEEMGVTDLVDYVRYPCLSKFIPIANNDDRICAHEKHDPQFWEHLTFEGQKALPQDMFLIDDAFKNCDAMRMAGGQFYYFDIFKKKRPDNNQSAVTAVKNWLQP